MTATEINEHKFENDVNSMGSFQNNFCKGHQILYLSSALNTDSQNIYKCK
jgi:hypothetical protein